MAKKKIKLGPVYNCSLCEKQFSKSGLLKAHMKTHDDAVFSCTECKYIGKTKKYLARHIERSHRKSKLALQCEFCNRRFQFKSQMEHHKLVHTGEKPYECKTCGKGFNSHHSLNSHNFIHTGQKPYQCAFCAYACRDSSTLRKHQHRHMGIETVFHCTQCDKKFKKKTQLKLHIAEQHLNVCVRNQECAQCGKMFRTKKDVGLHVKKVHSRATWVRCALCGRAVSCAGNLRAHLRTHAPQRPFACPRASCAVACRDQSGLKRHMLEVHSGERRHRCEHCGKRFYRKAHLNKHLTTHTPRTRAVQCDHCKMRFYSKNYLIKHINEMHNPKSPQLECDVCGFTTRNKIGLVMHFKGGHAPPEVECDICHSIYKRPMYLKIHYLRTHGIRYKTKQLNPPNFQPTVIVKDESAESEDDDTSLDPFELEEHVLEDVADPERSQKTLNEILEAIASNQTTIQEITNQKNLTEMIKPMKEIIEAAQEIQEVLNTDLNKDKFAEDTEKYIKDNAETSARQNKFVARHMNNTDNAKKSRDDEGQKREKTVKGVDASTNDKKSRCEKKSIIREDKEIQHEKLSEDITKMSIDKELNIQNKLQELAAQYEQESKQDIKDIEIENLQENRYENCIEIEVPLEIPHLNELSKNKEENSNINEIQEIKQREHDTSNEIEQLIAKIKSFEEEQAVTLEQDVNAIQETCIPNEDKLEQDNETSIEETRQAVQETRETIEEPSRAIGETTQIEIKNIEYTKYTNIKDIPESVFEKFYTARVSYIGNKVKEPHPYMDQNLEKEVTELIQQKLSEARQKEQVKALEKARREYNKRMKRYLDGSDKKKGTDKRELYTENPKPNNKNNDKGTNDCDDSNDESLNVSKVPNEHHNNEVNETYSLRKNRKRLYNDESLNYINEELDNDNDPDYENDVDNECNNKKRKINKVKFNTHQCYVCFKLYETKPQLMEHCKEHFDVCSDELLKKCPLCPFVGRQYFSKHVKDKHNITLKINYGTVGDTNDNSNGSRYYYKVKNKNMDKIEIIPSVRNLNRIASTKIDKKDRDERDKLVAKTKLVKKGKEWIVESEKININSKDFILPELDGESLKNVKLGDSHAYLDNLKRLYQIAKKDGRKMLFPCQNCDKICQNLSALTLHTRKHDPNAKPFKKKVWKHKVNADAKLTEKPAKANEASKNRLEKPRPIKNKHKCDPELKKFYENNIRGGDIEFWQFLKIFNKLGRENIKDFKDLRGRLEYGIEPNIPQNTVSENNENSTKANLDSAKHAANNLANPKNKLPNIKNRIAKFKNGIMKANNVPKNGFYKRVIRLSRQEYLRRKLLKQKLRENISENISSLE